MTDFGDSGYFGAQSPRERRAFFETQRQAKKVADTAAAALAASDAAQATGLGLKVAKAGDTMTGTLNIPTAQLAMGSVLGDRIYVYGTAYKFGIESGTLRYDADQVHRFMVGGTQRARIHGYGITTNSAYGGWAKLGGVDGNETGGGGSWNGVDSPGGYLLLAQTGQGPVYLRSRGAHNVLIGGAESNTISVGNAATTFSGYISAGVVYGGYVQVDNNQNSSVHSNMALQIRSSGTTAGLSMWPTNWGIAPTLRCFNGNGESIDCGNNPGTGYAQFGANNFVTWSARRGKKNIRTRDDDEKQKFRSAFGRIQTVVYDDAVGETKVAKSPRFSDVNKRWIASRPGRKPLTPKVPERDTVSVEHDCDQNDCNGTAEAPCGIVRRHINRRGIVAEELQEVLPQAVNVNMYGETMGIDYGVVLVEMIDVVQDLMARVEKLEAKAK